MSAYRKFIDTLQSGPCTPTPPKAPKVPKANPGMPVSLPNLGGLGALDDVPLKVENTAHAATHPRRPFSARDISGDVKGDAASDEDGSDMPLASIIAPGEWVERIALPASTEPGFSEPWPPRRGRIEWQANTLLHFCSVCGAWGSYGFGVNLRTGRMGQWFCAAHRPQGRTAP